MSTQPPEWFMALATKIDWSALDRRSQEVFRAYLIQFVADNLPVEGDSAVKRSAKLLKIAGLQLMAKVKH